MRFLVDVSAGGAVVEYLRRIGHDVVAVKETDPHAADEIVLARAVHEGRIVITADKDFGDLVFREGQAHAGVLLLRPGDPSPAGRCRLLARAVEHYGETLAGSFTVATDRRFRQDRP